MSNRQPYRWLFAIIGSLIGVIVLVAVYIGWLLVAPTETNNAIAFTPDNEYTGITAIEPPQPTADFTLTNQHGDPFSLSELSGKPTLITFGFTNCPDICPLTLSEFRQTHSELGEQANDLNFVFISVDGRRDTPTVLREYFQLYDVDSFIYGMTGDEAIVRELGNDYGLEFVYREPNETGWYNVDHTAGSFLLDADGNWIRRYAYATERALIIEDLQRVLN